MESSTKKKSVRHQGSKRKKDGGASGGRGREGWIGCEEDEGAGGGVGVGETRCYFFDLPCQRFGSYKHITSFTSSLLFKLTRTKTSKTQILGAHQFKEEHEVKEMICLYDLQIQKK
ncbi:hypothetical protein H5410_047240 [Solanum commersonii]|uniref:Uncharacterized protein n=1 Tax=Solanum commersonii TaxID=4109 RepID=A0A9J5XI25_SOLCO|nr:hypothetical protein H5410_047240 [Solanum commersonii]